MKNPSPTVLFTVLAAAAVILLPDVAHASAGGGGGLPFESALGKLQSSATGPVAFTMSIVGIVTAGGSLIFGGDLSGFFRSMVTLVLVIGMLVSAGNVLQSLFGVGATVTAPQAVVAPVGLDASAPSPSRQG